MTSYENINSGEFSKDVTSSGYITGTELTNNCSFVTLATGNNKWNFRVGAVTKTGMPIIQYCYENYLTDNRIPAAYIAYWNGSSWTQKNITDEIWKHEELCRGEGSIGKGQAIIPYDDTTWDLIVSYVEDGRGTAIEDHYVRDSGNLVGRTEPTQGKVYHMTRYCIVETDGTAGIPLGTYTSPGDITNALADNELNASNRAKPVRLGLKIMRTHDAGTTWHEVKRIGSNGIWGLGRHGSVVNNYFDTGKFFLFMADHTSVNKDYPDSTDILMVYEDLYAKDF